MWYWLLRFTSDRLLHRQKLFLTDFTLFSTILIRNLTEKQQSLDAYPDEDIYKPYVELLENQPFKMNTELEFIESLIAPGVKFIGDVDEHEEYLEKAYEIGQKF